MTHGSPHRTVSHLDKRFEEPSRIAVGVAFDGLMALA
jgi:hypothetical protein